VRFWDSSAVVPLVVAERASATMAALTTAGLPMYVWWGTRTEVAAALARLERLGHATPAAISECSRRLRDLAASWRELAPSELLRDSAERLLRAHDLQATGSLQLAAARIATADDPSMAEFVCLDAKLRQAAAREGFRLLPVRL
jgi:predicted nucleic acid-binding protein